MNYPVNAQGVLSMLWHAVTDIIHQTVQMIGLAVVAAVGIGAVVLLGVAILYVVLSWQGHRLEKPEEVQ